MDDVSLSLPSLANTPTTERSPQASPQASSARSSICASSCAPAMSPALFDKPHALLHSPSCRPAHAADMLGGTYSAPCTPERFERDGSPAHPNSWQISRRVQTPPLMQAQTPVMDSQTLPGSAELPAGPRDDGLALVAQLSADAAVSKVEAAAEKERARAADSRAAEANQLRESAEARATQAERRVSEAEAAVTKALARAVGAETRAAKAEARAAEAEARAAEAEARAPRAAAPGRMLEAATAQTTALVVADSDEEAQRIPRLIVPPIPASPERTHRVSFDPTETDSGVHVEQEGGGALTARGKSLEQLQRHLAEKRLQFEKAQEQYTQAKKDYGKDEDADASKDGREAPPRAFNDKDRVRGEDETPEKVLLKRLDDAAKALDKQRAEVEKLKINCSDSSWRDKIAQPERGAPEQKDDLDFVARAMQVLASNVKEAGLLLAEWRRLLVMWRTYRSNDESKDNGSDPNPREPIDAAVRAAQMEALNQGEAEQRALHLWRSDQWLTSLPVVQLVNHSLSMPISRVVGCPVTADDVDVGGASASSEVDDAGDGAGQSNSESSTRQQLLTLCFLRQLGGETEEVGKNAILSLLQQDWGLWKGKLAQLRQHVDMISKGTDHVSRSEGKDERPDSISEKQMARMKLAIADAVAASTHLDLLDDLGQQSTSCLDAIEQSLDTCNKSAKGIDAASAGPSEGKLIADMGKLIAEANKFVIELREMENVSLPKKLARLLAAGARDLAKYGTAQELHTTWQKRRLLLLKLKRVKERKAREEMERRNIYGDESHMPRQEDEDEEEEEDWMEVGVSKESSELIDDQIQKQIENQPADGKVREATDLTNELEAMAERPRARFMACHEPSHAWGVLNVRTHRDLAFEMARCEAHMDWPRICCMLSTIASLRIGSLACTVGALDSYRASQRFESLSDLIGEPEPTLEQEMLNEHVGFSSKSSQLAAFDANFHGKQFKTTPLLEWFIVFDPKFASDPKNSSGGSELRTSGLIQARDGEDALQPVRPWPSDERWEEGREFEIAKDLGRLLSTQMKDDIGIDRSGSERPEVLFKRFLEATQRVGGDRAFDDESFVQLLKDRNAHLRKLGEKELGTAELIGARLITGPMIVVYNRQLRNAAKMLLSQRKTEAGSEGSASSRRMRWTKFVTTIHVISSAIIKLSKLSSSAVVYRALPTLMPQYCLQEEHATGFIGGVVPYFTRASYDRNTALQPALQKRASTTLFDGSSGTGGTGIVADQRVQKAAAEEQELRPCCLLELRMTSDERGASLHDFGQYQQQDHHLVFFSPMSAINVLSSYVMPRSSHAANMDAANVVPRSSLEAAQAASRKEVREQETEGSRKLGKYTPSDLAPTIVIEGILISGRTNSYIEEVVGKRRSVVEAVWDEFRPELERSIQEDEVWQPLRAAQDSLRSGAASQSQMHQWTIERATRRILQERLSSKALHKPPEWYNQGSNMSEAIKLTVTLSKLVQSWPEGLAGLVKLTQPTCLFSYKSEEREGAQLARELQNKLSTAVSTREIDKQEFARFQDIIEFLKKEPSAMFTMSALKDGKLHLVKAQGKDRERICDNPVKMCSSLQTLLKLTSLDLIAKDLNAEHGAGLVVGVQALLRLSVRLGKVRLQGCQLGKEAADALLAGLHRRQTQLMIGFNGMEEHAALELAKELYKMAATGTGLTVLRTDSTDLISATSIQVQIASHEAKKVAIKEMQDELKLQIPDWINMELFRRLLFAAMETSLPSSVEAFDKFLMEPKYFIFGDSVEFRDGLIGFYKRLEMVEPYYCYRSMEDEFKENLKWDGSTWKEEYDYVMKGRTPSHGKGEYPSTKGRNDSAKLAYTRDIGELQSDGTYTRCGWTLEDFHKNQPAKADLTLAEVAALRLYTGPMFAPWNNWLRFAETWKKDWVGNSEIQDKGGPDVRNQERGERYNWATCVAVLYSAVIKLTALSAPAIVFRGVTENERMLPSEFIKGDDENLVHHRGGVEKAFMSTSMDQATAVDYAGGAASRGSILQIQFDMASRGASVKWVSQFPFEEELLFPPCTALTNKESMKIGSKQVLNVTPTISTSRPDVSWCLTAQSQPPSGRATDIDRVGPFMNKQIPPEYYGGYEVEDGGDTKVDLDKRGEVEITLDSRSEKEEGAPTGQKLEFKVYSEEYGNLLFLLQLSPWSKLTLDHAGKKHLKIPQCAKLYAFSYPCSADRDPRLTETLVKAFDRQSSADKNDKNDKNEKRDSLLNFVQAGGYVYASEKFEEEKMYAKELVHVVELREQTQGLNFKGPIKIGDAQVRERLYDMGRLQEASLRSLTSVGVKDFCWINPGEDLTPLLLAFTKKEEGSMLVISKGAVYSVPAVWQEGLQKRMMNRRTEENLDEFIDEMVSNVIDVEGPMVVEWPPETQDKINEPSYDGTVWEIVDVPPRLGGKIQLKRFRGDGVSMDESFLLNCGTKRFPVFTQEDKGRLISLHGADDANDVTLIESSGKGEPRKMDWKEARHTEVAKPLFITFVEEKIKGRVVLSSKRSVESGFATNGKKDKARDVVIDNPHRSVPAFTRADQGQNFKYELTHDGQHLLHISSNQGTYSTRRVEEILRHTKENELEGKPLLRESRTLQEVTKGEIISVDERIDGIVEVRITTPGPRGKVENVENYELVNPADKNLMPAFTKADVNKQVKINKGQVFLSEGAMYTSIRNAAEIESVEGCFLGKVRLKDGRMFENPEFHGDAFASSEQKGLPFGQIGRGDEGHYLRVVASRKTGELTVTVSRERYGGKDDQESTSSVWQKMQSDEQAEKKHAEKQRKHPAGRKVVATGFSAMRAVWERRSVNKGDMSQAVLEWMSHLDTREREALFHEGEVLDDFEMVALIASVDQDGIQLGYGRAETRITRGDAEHCAAFRDASGYHLERNIPKQKIYAQHPLDGNRWPLGAFAYFYDQSLSKYDSIFTLVNVESEAATLSILRASRRAHSQSKLAVP